MNTLDRRPACCDDTVEEHPRHGQPMTSTTTLPAGCIPVAEFRTTLFWPLTLHLREHGDNGDALSPFSEEALTRQLDAEICRLVAGGSWEPVPDLLDHIPASGRPNKDAADT